MNETGQFISKKRKEKGMTQKELAEQLGVTNKAVSKESEQEKPGKFSDPCGGAAGCCRGGCTYIFPERADASADRDRRVPGRRWTGRVKGVCRSGGGKRGFPGACHSFLAPGAGG